jgi:putative inorganic carbon (HCO3(-)) transporter
MAKLIRLLDRYQWVLLAAAAPFLIFPSPRRSLVLLVIPLIFFVGWLARREPIPPTPLNSSLLLMALMVMISIWTTVDLMFSLAKVTGLLLGFATYFAFAHYGRDTSGWRWGVVCLWGGGLTISCLSLIGTQWVSGKIDMLSRVTSLFPKWLSGWAGAVGGFNTNEIAGSLLWILPVVISMFLVRLNSLPSKTTDTNDREVVFSRFKSLLGMGFLTMFLLGVFLLTQSRTAYLSLAITFLVMLGISLPRPWRVTLIILILVGIVGAMVFLKQFGGMDIAGLNLDSVSADGTQSLATLGNRLELWSLAIDSIQDFPLIGMGMNVFRWAVERLYPFFLNSPGSDVSHAHNEFLQVALDLGIPGLVAFAALYLGAFIMLIELVARVRDTAKVKEGAAEPPRALILGLGGGLMAHLLYGMVDAVALGAKPGVIFWMILGLIAGLHSSHTPRIGTGSTGYGLPHVVVTPKLQSPPESE